MMHGGNVWQGNDPAAWLDFSANLRPEGAPDWVRQIMTSALPLTRYYPDRTLAQASRGIAAYAHVPESCVLPTAGGIAAIGLVCAISQGRVLTAPPTFGGYDEAAAAYGKKTGFYTAPCDLRPDDLRFLCNPNNPTGEVLSKEQVLREWALCRANDATLAADEAFIDYCPENSVRAEAASRENLVVVGSLTKSLCIPGVRLGYIIAREETIAMAKKRQLCWPLNSLAMAIAAELPAHLDELETDRRTNAVRREAFAHELRALGADVAPSQSNFLLARFDRPMALAADRLKAAHILVRRCDSFGLEDCFLRLAVKTEHENKRLLEALKGCL